MKMETVKIETIQMPVYAWVVENGNQIWVGRIGHEKSGFVPRGVTDTFATIFLKRELTEASPTMKPSDEVKPASPIMLDSS